MFLSASLHEFRQYFNNSTYAYVFKVQGRQVNCQNSLGNNGEFIDWLSQIKIMISAVFAYSLQIVIDWPTRYSNPFI